MITVDVIVPTIGRASLASAVDSALAQATDDLSVRVLIVNDSGTALTKSFGDQVTVIDTPGRTGVSAARNRGLAAVDAEFFALLDDDDVHLPGHLAAAVSRLTGAGADVYFCKGLVRYTGGRDRVEPAERLGDRTLREYLVGLSNWRSRSRRVLISSVVVRATRSAHRFDETMTVSEDTWWLLGQEAAGALVVDSGDQGIVVMADEQRDVTRRADVDRLLLAKRLAPWGPGVAASYLVGRRGRAAARAGDPKGVMRVALDARGFGLSWRHLPILGVELLVAAGVAVRQRIRR